MIRFTFVIMARKFIDQLGIIREVPNSPSRVISLVPSQTAYLAALGCDKEVVGITKFCVEPEEWFRTKQRVGGTKRVKHDRIKTLHPDLIIGNKEENTREDIEKLADYNLWLSDIKTLGDALKMMRDIGNMMHKEEKATEIIDSVHTNRKNFRSSVTQRLTPTVAYIIWRNPFMLVGQNTFIDTMLTEAGFKNCVTGNTDQRYPSMTMEEIVAMEPDYIFLSSEPYPFAEKHIPEWTDYFSEKKIKLIDAVPFSWYGSHLTEAFPYFAHLRQDLHI